MNTQHKDILTTIGRKQPITTADIAEYLMDHFGYGGGMEFDAFRDQVSKTIGYLKSKGEIVGEDIPQSKGKPLRYWALAHPQSDCQSADYSEHDLEMASDVAEVEAATEDYSATVETVTPEPVSVEVKVLHNQNMTIDEALKMFHRLKLKDDDMVGFMHGIALTENHHGVGK